MGLLRQPISHYQTAFKNQEVEKQRKRSTTEFKIICTEFLFYSSVVESSLKSHITDLKLTKQTFQLYGYYYF